MILLRGKHIPVSRLALCSLLLLPTACAEVPALLALRAALNQEYPHSEVGVRLTDESLLTVTFGNSPLAHGSCESRVAQALRVATFVRDHYNDFSSLTLINIEFAARQSRDSVPQTGPRLPIRFGRTAITAGLTGPDSARAVGTCKSWDELQGSARRTGAWPQTDS